MAEEIKISETGDAISVVGAETNYTINLDASDICVEFAEWLCRSAIRATDNKYWVYNGQNHFTSRELFDTFIKQREQK